MAYHADSLARTCVFRHDQCRGTPDFQYAGQNIAWAAGTGTNGQKGLGWISTFIDNWFDEYKMAYPSDIKQLDDT